MRTLQEKLLVFAVILSLICAFQVCSKPVSEDWRGLVQRTKRSLLWRWNSMKPVGAICKENLECGTKYCRKNICSFLNST
uniref:Liver-expressed antimicrobial peptide 2 n=1 Tax=Labrus bergylta TaxID=56723 RepID=A0A3Q3GH82_9LABR|nr:liver-expressed antimicrobial peptide 2-like [Labrus bergylta]